MRPQRPWKAVRPPAIFWHVYHRSCRRRGDRLRYRPLPSAVCLLGTGHALSDLSSMALHLRSGCGLQPVTRAVLPAGRTVYGPYGAAGSSTWYNPATGRFLLPRNWPIGHRGCVPAKWLHGLPSMYCTRSQPFSRRRALARSPIDRNGQAIQTGQITTAPGTTPGYRTSTGQRGIVTQGANGTVARGTKGTYVGHDGDVYSKDSRAPRRIEHRHKILAPLQDSRQPKITSTCNPTLLTD